MAVTEQYIENYLADGNFDLVIWAFNRAHIAREFENSPEDARDPARWKPLAEAILRHADAALKQSHTPFLVMYHPVSSETSGLENNWGVELTARHRNRPSRFSGLRDGGP
jgi:hypothetical protein